MNVSADISPVVEKTLCCTCGACAAVCRQEAITYKETIGGHLFPVIDKERCSHADYVTKYAPAFSRHGSA